MENGHNNMRLELVLVELKKLLKKLDINPNNWILFLHHADILQGYKQKYKRGKHLHILMSQNCVPWKVAKNELVKELKFPINSNYTSDLDKFIKKTGYDFEIIADTDDKFLFFKRYSFFYSPINNIKILMLSVKGNLYWTERYIKKWVKKMPPEVVLRRLEWRFGIHDLAKKKKDLEIEKLSKRIIDKFLPYTKGILSSAEKNKMVKKFEKCQELSGQVAFKGKIRGEIYILSPDKICKVKNGKILVCKITSPKLLPQVKVSKAIIADEGGILSHAAIISRELKIPCIIGTKVATQVFKNGDMVEVDAEKGIVSKIN